MNDLSDSGFARLDSDAWGESLDRAVASFAPDVAIHALHTKPEGLLRCTADIGKHIPADDWIMKNCRAGA